MLRKTVLQLEVTFDDQVTDAEALAGAVDTLLETALSTPGILDDYASAVHGPPKIGSVVVPTETRVVCFVEGGMVQGARANVPGIRFEVCDADCEEDGDVYVGVRSPEYESLPVAIY